MDKKNKILVGCLALLLALSVGYALFSETITINGTATAKGNFEITPTCTLGILSATGLTYNDLYLGKEGGYENDSCSVVDNRVNFSTDFLYPGAVRYFTVKFTNTGSINATLPLNADGDLGPFETAIFYNTITSVCELTEQGEKTNCKQRLEYTGGSSDFIRDETLGVVDKDGNYYSSDSDAIANFVDPQTGSSVLKPGESLYVVLGMYWIKDYKNDTNSANLSFEVNTEIPFKQVEVQ